MRHNLALEGRHLLIAAGEHFSEAGRSGENGVVFSGGDVPQREDVAAGPGRG